jgi:hypothetical protein
LRRVDGTAAEDDLARRCGIADTALPAERHAGRAPAFEQDLFGQCLGDDAQVGPLHCRAQIADSGRAAPAIARRRLVVADAVLARAVEIIVARKAELGHRCDKGFADRVLLDIRHAERAAHAVECVGTANLMLGALEIGQHVLE